MEFNSLLKENKYPVGKLRVIKKTNNFLIILLLKILPKQDTFRPIMTFNRK